MVSACAKRSSAQARHTVESCPPENSTSAVSVDASITQHLVPLRRSGKGIVDDAAIAAGERADFGHLVLAQLEIEDRGILREPFELAGARDDDDLLLHQE